MSWPGSRSLTFGAFFLIALLGFASAQEPVSDKALKYHKLLAARPEPGYLFDRFYNTWLDESTVDSLEAFLTRRAAESKQTSDKLLLAFFYVKKGDDVAALERFQEALADNPASAASWYHKSLVEARTLDFDAAIADLKTAREQSPDQKLAVKIDKQLGRLLVRNRQTSEALKVWQSLLASHPSDDELAEDLIELELDEGLFKEAESQSAELIGRTNDQYLNVMRRLRLGDIYHRAGDREKAVEAYTATLDDVGSGTWIERQILAQIEQVMRREDDVAGLKKLYGELVKKYPKRIAIQRRNAQLLLEHGENDQALAAYREVLQLTPGDRATREEFVTMLAKTGQQDEAVKELRALCEQHAKDPELRFRLATLLLGGKKEDEATAAIDEYLAVSDGSEYAHLRAARLLERLQSKDAATRVYREMAEKFADSASAQEAYAAFLYAQDRKSDAVARWKTLAEKADLNETLHVARALSARSEHQVAFDVLTARHDAFAKEPLFLGQIVTTALALKKYDEAIPPALARVELAASVADLENALDQAAVTLERAEKVEDTARELQARSDRSIPQNCLLAELWELSGDSTKADQVLAAAAPDGNLYVLSEQIRLQSERRDWAAAAEATRRILELPEGRKSLYVRRLVELYQRDFQYEEGLKWIQEWKRLSPGSTMPWVTEARLLSGLGKSDDALKVLRTAVQQFVQDDDLRVRLAEFYVAADKPADAERIYWLLYEQTEDLSGKLRWAQELGKLAQQEGTVEQVVENFNERAQLNRRSIVPLLSLAEVYRQADDYEGRRRALTAAAKIKPDDIQLLTAIARVEEQDGDWQAAVATLERAAALDKTIRTREQIALLHLQYGEQEQGFSLLLELAGGPDADPRTIETTADALCAMQEWERAADFLRELVLEHPADYRLRYLYGVALEEADRNDAAVDEFVQLLEPQEELPGKKSRPASGPNTLNSYYGMMRQLMPPEAAEWFELMQYRYQAYMHRQRSGLRAVMAPTAASMRSSIQMPDSTEMVRPLAMTHALSIAATLDEDRQQEIYRVLESHGMKHADAFATVDMMRGDFAGAMSEILDKQPDDETALAILVLQRIGGQDDSRSEHVARAVDMFRESRPQLAFMAAIQAGANEAATPPPDDGAAGAGAPGESDTAANAKKVVVERTNKYFDQALDLAATFDEPNPLIVIGLTTALGGQPGRTSATNIDEAYRKKFSKLMLDWYPKLTKSPYGSYAFYMVVQSLSQSEDHANFIRFLDDEVGRFQAVGNPSSRNFAAQRMFYGRNAQQSLVLPTFPPEELVDFPPNVLAIFGANRQNPFGNVLTPPGGDADPATILKPLLETVKSPVLRLLLAHRAEMDNVVDETLAKMLAAKTPSVDAYLLAAGRAADKEDYVEAVRLLAKARYLPMNQEARRRVDSGIVAAVLAIKDDKDKANAELIEAGQQACLRLRRARLDPAQRNELITAMDDLGLKKEAKKLDELASAATSSTSAVSRGVIYSSGRVATTPPDRVAKLIADGKTDVAVRLLSNEVTAQVRQALASGQSSRFYGYQIRQVKQRLDSWGLTDEVLKSLDPGDTRNPARISEYAMACRMFDNNAEARKQFERVLALRPRDDAARMQLILLVGADDSQTAAKQLDQLSKTARDQFGQMLAEQLQDYEASLDERISYAELLVKLVAAMDEGDAPQSNWSEYALHSLGRQMGTNRGSGLPSLYALATDAEESRQRRGATEQEQHRRVEAHTALCLEMLKKPSVARAGFRHLLAAAEARGDKLDEFAERAVKILTDEANARPGRTASNQQRFSWNSNEREVRFREPEEFLARRAWKSGDWKEIDETLLPMLAAHKTREQQQRLAQLAELYRCPDDEFLGHAEDDLRRSHPDPRNSENSTLAIVVDVWADRQLSADLQSLVLRQLKLDVNSPNHSNPPGYLTRYLKGAAATWDHRRQLDFVDELATIYIAPRDRRDDFMKKNYQPNNINYGTPNGRIYVFGRLLDRLSQEPALLFTVLEHLESYEISPVENLEYRVQAATIRVVNDGTEATLELLDGSPWLLDLDHFKPLVFSGGRNTPLVNLLEQVNNKPDVRDQIRKELTSRQAKQPTFGIGLVLAGLDQKDDKLAVLNYLGTKVDSILELPDDAQFDLSSLIQDLIRRDALADQPISESASAARTWILGGQAGKSQALLAKVNKVKRLPELGIRYYQVDDFFRTSLAAVIQADPPTAAKIFLRISDLAHESQRRGEWQMYLGAGKSTEGYLLRQAMYSTEAKDWSTYNFVVDVLRNDQHRGVEAADAAPRAAGNAVNAAMERASKSANGKRPPISDRILALYEECGPALAGRPSSLMMRGFYERLEGQLDEKSCAAVRSWTSSEAGGGKYPQLAADLDATVAFMAAQKMDAAAKKKYAAGERRELADYHQHFLAIFRDEQLPLTWRVYLAEFLTSREREAMPIEVARAIAKLHSNAIAAGVPIADGEQRWLSFAVYTLRDDPASADLVKEWRDRWAARFLKGGQRQQFRRGEYENLDSLTNSDALCRTLALYFTGNESDRATRLLRNYESIGNLPLTAAVLVRARQPAEAAKLIRGNWSTLVFDWPNDPTTQYDAEFAAQVPATFDAIDRDDLRYFARLFFASMPDLKTPGPKASEPPSGELPPRDERLRELSAKLNDVKFTDKQLYRRALVLLSRSPATRADVAERISKEYDVERLASAFMANGRTPQLTQETQLAECYLRKRLGEGDAAELAKLLKRLNANPADNDYEYGQRVEPLLNSCRDVLREPGDAWTAEDCAHIVAELQAAYTNREYVYFPDYRGFNSLLVALIARADNLPDAQKWLKSLPQNSYRQMVNQGLHGDVWKFALRLSGTPTTDNLDARIRSAENVLGYAIGRKWARWDQRRGYYLQGDDGAPYFASLVKSQLVSADELKQHGDELIKAVDNREWGTAAYAAWLESVDEYARAADIWQQVVDDQPEPKNDSKQIDERLAYEVLSLARSLSKCGRGGDATTAIARLDGKQLPPPLRMQVEKLRRELADDKQPETKSKGG
jgi:tetratricopeptide (TPR) repeat protein